MLLWDGEHVHSRPCFDASGERILVMRAPAGDDPVATAGADASPWSLWSLPRTGGDPELLFEHPVLRATRPDPCWSTGRIAFTGIRSGRGELWVINADGTGLTHIPVGDPPLPRVFYPSWFSDRDRIAVTDYQAHQVLSVSISTGEVTPLSDPGQVWAGMCAVSPGAIENGPVAFAGQPPVEPYDVAANLIWLTQREGPARQLDGKHGRTPAWSPVGRHLAFSSTRPRMAPTALIHERTLPGGRSGVFIASPGHGPGDSWVTAPVSPLDHEAVHPKWSPQGDGMVLMAETLGKKRSGIALLEF